MASSMVGSVSSFTAGGAVKSGVAVMTLLAWSRAMKGASMCLAGTAGLGFFLRQERRTTKEKPEMTPVRKPKDDRNRI